MISLNLMKNLYRKTVLLAAMSLIFLSDCLAQPKSIGATFSFSGIQASYTHNVDSGSFIDASVKAECGDWFYGKSRFPGVSASVVWNMIFGKTDSVNGNEIRFYAGPGICAGLANDLYRPMGLVFGLKGSIGVECEFDRHVIISAALSPVIGTHVMFPKDHVDMRCFRMGLLSAVMPEIGVRYTFGK